MVGVLMYPNNSINEVVDKIVCSCGNVREIFVTYYWRTAPCEKCGRNGMDIVRMKDAMIHRLRFHIGNSW